MIRKYAEIFCWKNVSSFCSAKATHIFSAKNIRILYIESAKTVNEMTLNELVQLTTLWTTGPWSESLLEAHVRRYIFVMLRQSLFGSQGQTSKILMTKKVKPCSHERMLELNCHYKLSSVHTHKVYKQSSDTLTHLCQVDSSTTTISTSRVSG